MPAGLTSIHGSKLQVDNEGNLYSGFNANGTPRLVQASSQNPFQKVRMADDFQGDLITDEWAVVVGSGGSATVAITIGIGGLLLFTSDDTAGTMAADGAQLVGVRSFQASNGGLVFECRIRNNTALTTRSIFCGLTDVATIEAAIVSAASADTITTTATDAFGFMFDSRMTTDEWWAVGVANDVDAVHVSTGVAPVADAFDRLRVECDAAGKARFYVNGVLKATLTGVVTPAIDLVPTISIFSTTTAVVTATADYILAEMDR